jgi:hypothetical protein
VNVSITSAARKLICGKLARYRPYHAVLLITRKVASGELTRRPSGESRWRIVRPIGWEANVAELRFAEGTPAKRSFSLPVAMVADIPVWVESKARISLRVHVRNRKLHVDESRD